MLDKNHSENQSVYEKPVDLTDSSACFFSRKGIIDIQPTHLIEESPHRRSAMRTSRLGTRDTACRARTCRPERTRLLMS
jgi:hypothetical protein